MKYFLITTNWLISVRTVNGVSELSNITDSFVFHYEKYPSKSDVIKCIGKGLMTGLFKKPIEDSEEFIRYIGIQNIQEITENEYNLLINK